MQYVPSAPENERGGRTGSTDKSHATPVLGKDTCEYAPIVITASISSGGHALASGAGRVDMAVYLIVSAGGVGGMGICLARNVMGMERSDIRDRCHRFGWLTT